jgi:hypothetical protein
MPFIDKTAVNPGSSDVPQPACGLVDWVDVLPGPTLDELKAAKTIEVNAAFEVAASTLTAGYPDSEQKTWPMQQAEATAWKADSATPTPYLDAIAAVRGIDPTVMRQKVLDNVSLFVSTSQTAVGLRQKFVDEIAAATTPEQIAAIRWPEATPQ